MRWARSLLAEIFPSWHERRLLRPFRDREEFQFNFRQTGKNARRERDANPPPRDSAQPENNSAESSNDTRDTDK